MCFINLTTKIIAKENGINALKAINCWDYPCIVITGTDEHLHNITIVGDKVGRDLVKDALDYDTLLKLQGKSN